MTSNKVNIKKLSDEIKLFLKNKDFQSIQNLSEKYYETDIADAITLLSEKEIIVIIRILKSDTSSEVFTFLDPQIQKQIIEKMNSKEIREMFEQIFTDDIVDILEEMPSNIVKKILRASSEETRTYVNEILQYEEHTAGGVMSTNFIKIKENMTVNQTIQKIRSLHQNTEEVNEFFVVDEYNNLKGYITLKNLIFTSSNKLIKTIINSKVISASTSTDQEEIVSIFKKYNLNILPIINKKAKLVGVITVDDVIDILEEEVTEDIHKMAGISPIEEHYFKISIWKMVRSRSFWLLLLMISATLSQIVISGFMHIYGIDSVTQVEGKGSINITYIVTMLLTPLLTVISGTAGNAGSQSSTMVVRALSLNEVTSKDFGRVLWKELRVALITGLILISANFIRMISIYAVEFKGDINRKELWYSIATLSIAMYLTLIVSKVVGGTLPIIAKKVKLDPAVMAAPLLTTIVDALSTCIFFSVGLIFFSSYITI